jgi:hypothetical protein
MYVNNEPTHNERHRFQRLIDVAGVGKVGGRWLMEEISRADGPVY